LRYGLIFKLSRDLTCNNLNHINEDKNKSNNTATAVAATRKTTTPARTKTTAVETTTPPTTKISNKNTHNHKRVYCYRAADTKGPTF